MLLFLVISLFFLLICSVIGNFLFWKACNRQLIINQIYTDWILELRKLVFKTYAHIKLLDEKQMFEKDDEVGVVFQDMLEVIKNLNDKIEETTEEE